MIEICRHQVMAPLVPGDLLDAYMAALTQAAKATLECLELHWDASDYRVLLGGLAALQGKPALGASILTPPGEIECPECSTYFLAPRYRYFQLPADAD